MKSFIKKLREKWDIFNLMMMLPEMFLMLGIEILALCESIKEHHSRSKRINRIIKYKSEKNKRGK